MLSAKFLFLFHLKGKHDVLELFRATHFSIVFIMYDALSLVTDIYSICDHFKNNVTYLNNLEQKNKALQINFDLVQRN